MSLAIRSLVALLVLGTLLAPVDASAAFGRVREQPEKEEEAPAPRRSAAPSVRREERSTGSFGRTRPAPPRPRRERASSDSHVVVRHRHSAPRYYYTYDAWDPWSPYEYRAHRYYTSSSVVIAPWGFYAHGYTPYWGTPGREREAAPREVPSQAPRHASTSMFLGGMLGQDSAGLAGELTFDTERLGFNLRGTAVGLPDPYYGGLDMLPLFSAHLTWSPVSTPHARVRLEAGLSGIHAPDVTYYGPDVGVSGQWALLGPVALVGAARLTPFPATIVDVDAGVGLQFGTLGVRAGWRWLTLDDRWANVDGGVADFSGPSLSMGAVF